MKLTSTQYNILTTNSKPTQIQTNQPSILSNKQKPPNNHYKVNKTDTTKQTHKTTNQAITTNINYQNTSKPTATTATNKPYLTVKPSSPKSKPTNTTKYKNN